MGSEGGDRHAAVEGSPVQLLVGLHVHAACPFDW